MSLLLSFAHFKHFNRRHIQQGLFRKTRVLTSVTDILDQIYSAAFNTKQLCLCHALE